MSEMVERVARAICPTAWENGRYFNSCKRRWEREQSLRRARAAIEEMRRPTEEMALAGRPTSLYPGRTFAAMIDEALKSNTQYR